MVPSLKCDSLAEQASEAIVEYISERGLRDEDGLSATTELAGMLHVSVPVVREAIAGLSMIGLLKRQHGRETTVSMPDSTHLARLLAFRVAGANVAAAVHPAADEALPGFEQEHAGRRRR